MSHFRITAFCCIYCIAGTAYAQFGGFGGYGPPGSDDNPFDSSDGDGNGADGSSVNQGFGFSSSSTFSQANRVLIAHAVMASLAWVILIPVGAIFLRLNINRPFILRLHAIWQIFSFIIYVVAVGMGIWLVQQTPRNTFWDDPHPKLGLAILVITFFQPIWGYVHHRMYKKQDQDLKTGRSNKKPGRTVNGRIHLWVGRLLIVLGIMNGGLGIRLASRSPFQTDETTRKAKIAYAVVAASMFLVYALITVIYEIRRVGTGQHAERAVNHEHIMMKDQLPTYDESQESLEREQRIS